MRLFSKDSQTPKNSIFSISLVQLRLRIAPINAVLFGLALGFNGTVTDYIIVFSYFFMNLILGAVKGLQYLATRPLRFFILGIDLLIAGYMITRTGGLNSNLYPFLFIPVLVAVLRLRYSGIFIWCTICSVFLAVIAFYTNTMMIITLFIRISYLYLVGLIGGYLISHTFSVTEEVSKRLTRWNIELQRLNNFSHEVAGSSDLDEIFEQTIKTVMQNSSLPMAAMMIFNEMETLQIYAHKGWEDKWLASYAAHPLTKESDTLAAIIGYRKSPLICPDIKKHQELVKIFGDTSVESLYAFPLVAVDEVIGILLVASSTVRSIPEREYPILASIANQASLAIQNATSLHHEKKKADTDGLTGLYNRRYFNEQMEVLTTQALTQKTHLSLILIDIDDFKKYNDTFGHPDGDQLLIIVTKAMLEAVREQDLVARYGGEEFAVILDYTDNETTIQIAERVRLAVANLSSPTVKSTITISVGVASIPDQANDRECLVDFADKSLYFAKSTGKNKVCCGYSAD